MRALKLRIQRAQIRSIKKQHELNYLFWECTTRCNLHCLHCGSDCSKDSEHPDMPLEDFLEALDTLRPPARNFTVVLSGGEPLLRKDLESCGKAIRRRGMGWGIVSNGMAYSPERHQSLLSAGMGSLTLSLDGMEAGHNWLRNNGQSFSHVIRAIKLAVAAPQLNFDVVSCVNRQNVSELEAMYNLLSSLGLKAWRLFTILPIGRAKDNPALLISNQEFKSMLDFITGKRAEGGMDIKFSCEGYLGPYENKVRPAPYFCRAGINIGSVLIDGSISACPNIDRSFIQGNIYRDNLQDVWDNRFQVFRDREWTRRGPCAQCSSYAHCQGNGFHNWHGDKTAPLVCHMEKLTS